MLFEEWYTDTADIFRTVEGKRGNVDTQERQKINASPVPCRVYSSQKSGPHMTENAARVQAAEKMACALGVDIRAGDELLIIRGGNLGHENPPVRYFAGEPVPYYDPVDGALTGLEHQEIGLLKENIIGR